MRKGATTDDYRNALNGKGELGSLGYDWADKPHRLAYDLCSEVDRLRMENWQLKQALGYPVPSEFDTTDQS